MARVAKVVLISVAIIMMIVVAGLIVFSGTYFGRERVRRFALDAMRDMVNGEIIVGRIEGNLLDRFELVDVSIVDENGQPFLVADRVSARIALAPLLSKRIVVHSLHLEQPVITLSKAPGGTWNYLRIFEAGDTVALERAPGFGSWVDLHDITIRNGTLLVHQPYPSDESVRRTVGDSAALALAEESRLRVERVGGMLRQTMEFRDIDGRIPRLVAAHPDSVAITFRIAQLSMEATPLQAPDLIVRQMEGDVRVLEDTVTLRDVELHLPASKVEGAVTYHVSAGDLALDLQSDTLSLKDIQMLHPAVPDRGGGRLELKAIIRDTATSVYEFTNTRVTVDGSRVAGRLGMAVNPGMFELRETDLQFTRLTTQLVEQLVPGLDIEVPGAFTGRARLSGPPNALRTDIAGTYDPASHPSFRVSANGIVGTGEVTRLEDLKVDLQSVPMSLVSAFVPGIRFGGTVTVDARVSGSTASQFSGLVTITHREATTSTVVAEGFVSPGDNPRLNVNLRFAPISMELVQRYAPETDVRGEVRGTGTVRGTLRDLRAGLDLQVASGNVTLDGTFDLESPTRTYNAVTQLRNVDLQATVPTLPATALNGTATVAGSGTTLRTADARITMDVRDAVVDSTEITQAVVVATTRDGRVTVDSLRLETNFAVATASGTFGLVNNTTGTLNYTVDVRNLAGLERWIATGDTTSVTRRPLVRQRMAASGGPVRTDPNTDTSLASVLARRQDPSRPVSLPGVEPAPTLRRDSISGTATVRGTLEGSVARFTATGEAALDHLVWDGYEVGRGTADFTVVDAGTPDMSLTTKLGVDSLQVKGFAFDSTHVEGTYRDGAGNVTLAVFPGDTAQYRVQARYALHTDHGEVHLEDVNLKLDSVTWRSARPSTISWQGVGLTIDSLDLRSGGGRGRIFVHGEMPDRDPGRLEIRIDSLGIAPWATLLQAEVPVDGKVSLDAVIDGTRTAPRITGSVALVEHRFKNVPFPEVHSTFSYDDRRFRFEGDLRRGANGDVAARSLARLTGTVPVDLSLGDSIPTRKLPGPITVDLEGDSIPLGPIAEMVDEITVLTGEARGRVGLRGTWDRIRYDGAVAINIPLLGLQTPGITLTNTTGRLRMTDDRLVVDSLVSHSQGPIRVSGSVALADVANPVFDLALRATEARIMDNEDGSLVVSSRLAVRGPLNTVAIDGALVVVHGILRIPDPQEFNVINTGDPTLFAIVDTSLTRELELEPPSPILKNADVNVNLQVRRGTWARSREANVEVFGDLVVERHAGDTEFTVTGALHSDYGDYELYGRRFSVTRGSVRWTGPASNPVLQLLATHEVRQAGRAPFEIHVTISGTLERPNLSLSSQAQPTLTQSDLISFLAFGKSTTSLLTFEGSGLEGGGLAGSSLAGSVASLATQQLGGVALGALFAELETSLSERTAVDVLRVRPAELPPGLSLGDLETLARGTQIEVGKYLDRNTFFVGQFRSTLAVPGATLERRFGTQFRMRTSLETRYTPLTPSLATGLQPKTFQVFGALLMWTRSW